MAEETKPWRDASLRRPRGSELLKIGDELFDVRAGIDALVANVAKREDNRVLVGSALQRLDPPRCVSVHEIRPPSSGSNLSPSPSSAVRVDVDSAHPDMRRVCLAAQNDNAVFLRQRERLFGAMRKAGVPEE
jgi:hypothetical protein